MKRFKHPILINTSEVSKYMIIMTVGEKVAHRYAIFLCALDVEI